jgi:hypothetical protein
MNFYPRTGKNLKREQKTNSPTINKIIISQKSFQDLLGRRDTMKLADWMIVKLNKYSNNYGLDWGRSILFTIIVGFIFFIFYVPSLEGISVGWGGWQNYFLVVKSTMKFFPQFLYAAHDFELIKGYESTGLSYSVDILSRIFIGFGYYQTIQAFRKYGRW